MLTAGQATDQIRQTIGRLATPSNREGPAQALSATGNFSDRTGALGLPLALVFIGAAAAILLIICANVGNLLLARAAERRGEMAVRASLGATRGRIIAQMFTENLLLAVVASGLGLLFAIWAVPVLWRYLPFYGLPPLQRFGLDWRVAGVAGGVGVLATLIFGTAPALEAADVDLAAALKGASAAVAGRDRMAGGRQGVVTQVGLSIALFTLAVQFGRSFEHLRTFDVGFAAGNVLQVPVDLQNSVRSNLDFARAYVDGAVARAGRDPNVRAVAVRGNFASLIQDSVQRQAQLQSMPVGRRFLPSLPDNRILAPGSRNSPLPTDMIPSPVSWVVSPDYFGAVGLRIVRGRGFTTEDRGASAPVAVVSERLARVFWPGEDPVGKRVRIGARGSIMTVVGVASDARVVMGDRSGLHGDAAPYVYVSELQAVSSNPTLLFRVVGDPLAAAPAIISGLTDLDSERAAGAAVASQRGGRWGETGGGDRGPAARTLGRRRNAAGISRNIW